VLTEMRGFAAKTAAGEPAVRELQRQGRSASRIVSAEDKPALKARCQKRWSEWCGRPYGKLIAFFEGQLTRATTDDGVWKLPDGAAFYAWRLRQQTTTNMTPEQVHALGLAEVARIDAQMRTILSAQGQLQAGETPRKRWPGWPRTRAFSTPTPTKAARRRWPSTSG